MLNRLANLFRSSVFWATLLLWSGSECLAQNDWQYPDPYFGILEIEKSVDSASSSRWRSERAAIAKPLPPIRGQHSKRPRMRRRLQTAPQVEKNPDRQRVF